MLELFSPAKLNLFFKLVGQREDGYHNLESLFQAINLFDRIGIRFSPTDRFTSNTELSFNEDNFLIKALFVFREKTQLNDPVEITLDKKIPMEAGLGGGSSNASTLLWGLNELYNRPATTKQLQEWSAEITCDSPFFFSKGTALCTAKGEVVENLEPLPPQNAWLIKPPEGNSTPAVYKASKATVKTHFKKEKLLESFYAKNPIYHNDLEAPAFSLSPTLSKLKQELEKQEYSAVFMTGSGTGLVCIGEQKPKVKPEHLLFPIQYINRSRDRWYSPKP